MKKFLGIISLILTLALVGQMGMVFAAYNYYIPMAVYNNSTEDRSNFPVLVTINNSQLASAGYINATGLDTNVQEGAIDRGFMVGTSRLGVFLPSLLGYQQSTLNYRLGDSTGQTTFPIIVGPSGNITVSDDDSLELGNNFTIEQKGYIDTSAGSDKNLIYKGNAFKLYISAAGSIKAEVVGGNSVTATNVTSGVHAVKVYADGITLAIQIDAETPVTNAVGFAGVPDESTNWAILENNVMPYMEYLKVMVG